MITRRTALMGAALAATATAITAKNVKAASESMTPEGKEVDRKTRRYENANLCLFRPDGSAGGGWAWC